MHGWSHIKNLFQASHLRLQSLNLGHQRINLLVLYLKLLTHKIILIRELSSTFLLTLSTALSDIFIDFCLPLLLMGCRLLLLVRRDHIHRWWVMIEGLSRPVVKMLLNGLLEQLFILLLHLFQLALKDFLHLLHLLRQLNLHLHHFRELWLWLFLLQQRLLLLKFFLGYRTFHWLLPFGWLVSFRSLRFFYLV